jgi:hypothetical protein
MQQQRSYRASLIVAAAIAGSVMASGQAGDSRVFDADRHDFRRWQGRAEHAFRTRLVRAPEALAQRPSLPAEPA